MISRPFEVSFHNPRLSHVYVQYCVNSDGILTEVPVPGELKWMLGLDLSIVIEFIISGKFTAAL